MGQLLNKSVEAYQRRLPYLGTIPAYAPSTTAAQLQTIEITGAYNLEAIQIAAGTITSAMIQQIRLAADGVIFQTWGANNILDERVQYDGGPAVAANGIITIPFNRLGIVGGVQYQNPKTLMVGSGDLVSVAGESSLNMGSSGGGLSPIQALQITLTVVNTPATTSSMAVYGIATPSLMGGPGPVLRVIPRSKSLSNGSVSFNKTDFGFDAQTQLLNRIYFDVSQGLVLDQVKIEYGGQVWRNFVPAAVQANVLQGLFGPIKANVQSGLYVIDFQGGGVGTDLLDLTDPATDFNIQATASGLTGSPSVPFYVEVLGPAKAS